MRALIVIQSTDRRAGLTLFECLLALVVLSLAVLGISYAATAGHQHLQHSDVVLRAVRLAEHLMEEIVSRPYSGAGTDRATWHLTDYDGFHENAGDLRDFSGVPYVGPDQAYSRSVSITDAMITVPAFESMAIPGKTVLIIVRDADGREWRLSRFIPEPVSP